MFLSLTEIQKWDSQFQFYLNQEWRYQILDKIAQLLSSGLILGAIVGLFVFYIAYRYRRRNFRSVLKVLLLVGIAAGVTYGACTWVKYKVERLRPYQAVAGTYHLEKGQWVRNPPDFVATEKAGVSFPSGHAANITAISLALFLLMRRKMRWWEKGSLLVLFVAVCWSRVYLGMHYPTDVMGGALLAVVSVWILWMIWRFIEDRFFEKYYWI